jgi:phenol 2-monooxygenase
LQHFESQLVVCIADAHPVHLGDRLTSNGRWRLVIFTGKLTQLNQRTRFEKLCSDLVAEKSPLKIYQTGPDIDSFIELLTVISSERAAINLTEYPDISRPACGKYRYRKYNTIFADEVSYHEGGGQAYKRYGVDPDGPGVVILIRVIQVIGFVPVIYAYYVCFCSLTNMLPTFCHLTNACLN